MNWNWVMQAGSALVTYAALMGTFLAGVGSLEFALCTAVLLCLWLSLYSIASARAASSHAARLVDPIVPSLSDSMAELHSLQSEINTLQAQFAAQSKTRMAPDDPVV